jgi:hypothetical protein
MSETRPWHHPAEPPPLLLSFTAITDPLRTGSLAGLWSAVWGGASQNTDQFLVPGCGECRGGRFAVGPGLSLFLSGLLMPHRSVQFPETSRLYSLVTYHTRTCNTLHVPGIFVFRPSWSLAVGQKMRPVRDVPCSS